MVTPDPGCLRSVSEVGELLLLEVVITWPDTSVDVLADADGFGTCVPRTGLECSEHARCLWGPSC